MFTNAWNRLRRRRLHRHPLLRIVLLVLLVWDSLHILHIYNNQHRGAAAREAALRKYRTQRPWVGEDDDVPQTVSDGSFNSETPKLFIASQHWNSASLLRERWNAALISLVNTLGPENVFVSIYESGSYDDTKAALRDLDASLEGLGVRRSIVLEERSHKDEIADPPAKEEERPREEGWVRIPQGRIGEGEWGRRRIPFLAELRNRGLEPLEREWEAGRRWGRVLFLNDVVFTPSDVLTLLDTNSGHYAAACALDFARPPYYYDTFALRDAAGHETVSQLWPYFRSSTSRRAVERFDAVAVASCWNGMVAMDAAPFVVASQAVPKATGPLRFRAIPDSLAAHHLEASECCLIHADNPLSSQRGVWLNPNVRVAYNGSAYEESNRQESVVLGPARIWARLWFNRLVRWGTWVGGKEAVVRWRVRRWMREGDGRGKREEPGEFCLINEMQILHEKGWRHV